MNVKNAKQKKKKKEQEEEGAQAIRFLFHDFIISDGQRMLSGKNPVEDRDNSNAETSTTQISSTK